MIRAFRPEIILANAPSDRHPDHGKGSSLVREASFLSGLSKVKTAYEEKDQDAWRPKELFFYIQDRYTRPDFVVDISDYFDKKLEVIKCFSSQFYTQEDDLGNTPISGKDFLQFIEGRARQLGREAGYELGEGFVSERIIGVNTISKLLN